MLASRSEPRRGLDYANMAKYYLMAVENGCPFAFNSLKNYFKSDFGKNDPNTLIYYLTAIKKAQAHLIKNPLK